METARVAQYVKDYLAGLKSGADLPDTELQPADDLIILAGNTLVSLWQLTGDEIHLYTAAAVLEFASTKSKHAFRIKLLLIRVYRLIGNYKKYMSAQSLTFVASVQARLPWLWGIIAF
jgi:N-terminal acetyltransferase B complex non-catalytic subunit